MLFITAYTLTSALGAGIEGTIASLRQQRSGLTPYILDDQSGETWVGAVQNVSIDRITDPFSRYECRSNRLLRDGSKRDGFEGMVADCRERYGPNRIGCFVGTITSGLLHLEEAYKTYDSKALDLGPDVRLDFTANVFSATDYCRQLFALEGPALTVGTACSSSAKVFATAWRFVNAGLCDAAVVGGIDCLCGTILYGFRSLGLLSPSPCRPWDRRRNGINIGEAAGLVLLEKEPRSSTDVALLGYGESSDAFHMTSPDPNGRGAELAMRAALKKANLQPQEIDYINLHGSGSPANDASEDAAVYRVFGDGAICSSTKGWTGHAQGAAGITEAIISILSIKESVVPATLNTTEIDSQLRIGVQLSNMQLSIRNSLTNSFGFGGNNCSLILGIPK